MYPLVAVLQALAAAHAPISRNESSRAGEILYIGRAGSVEERIAADLGIPFTGIQVGGLRSMGAQTQARNFMQMAQASRFAGTAIAHFKPNAVLATGGYVSAPVLWAAWRKQVPIVIDLPDLEPGWAISATWRLSKQVAVSFPEVLHYFGKGRAAVTGYPVRQEFFAATRAAGITHFELDSQLPVVTVFGGSQGAHALNQAVRMNLNALLRASQVLHICGMADREALVRAREQLPAALAGRYRVFDYLKDDMPLALAAADIVVARAGAATLGEFPAIGVPSILVPGLFAQGHQAKNADFLATRGAAVHLPEPRLEHEFLPTVVGLLNDGIRLNAMRDAVKKLAQPDAAKRIGELLVAYAA